MVTGDRNSIINYVNDGDDEVEEDEDGSFSFPDHSQRSRGLWILCLE